MADVFQKRVYGLLTGDEDARVCKDIPEEACDEQPRNYLVHLVSLSLTKSGDKFIDPKITLAWLMSTLGVPAAYLSLLVPVHNAFSLLPQLAVASYMRRLPVRKWLWCVGAIGQAFAILGICFTAAEFRGGAAGLAIIGSLLLFSISRGACSVSHKDVLGKTVSKTRRGSVSGYADAVGGLAAAVLACWLILGDGRNLTVVVGILLVAAFCWLLAAGTFSLIVESPGATEGGDNALREAIQQVGLLKTHAGFRHFVISRTLLLGTALMPPYLVVLISSRESQSLDGLGFLLLSASVAGFVSAPLWGRFADRSSRRTMMLGGTVAGMTGLLALLCAELGVNSELTLALGLFGLYVGHAGVRIGRKTHLVDMAAGENRASFVAVSNMTIGIALLGFAGLGALIDNLVLHGGLLFFSLMALCGALYSVRLQEAQ